MGGSCARRCLNSSAQPGERAGQSTTRGQAATTGPPAPRSRRRQAAAWRAARRSGARRPRLRCKGLCEPTELNVTAVWLSCEGVNWLGEAGVLRMRRSITHAIASLPYASELAAGVTPQTATKQAGNQKGLSEVGVLWALHIILIGRAPAAAAGREARRLVSWGRLGLWAQRREPTGRRRHAAGAAAAGAAPSGALSADAPDRWVGKVLMPYIASRPPTSPTAGPA